MGLWQQYNVPSAMVIRTTMQALLATVTAHQQGISASSHGGLFQKREVGTSLFDG